MTKDYKKLIKFLRIKYGFQSPCCFKAIYETHGKWHCGECHKRLTVSDYKDLWNQLQTQTTKGYF